MHGRELLKEGLVWRIGNGRSIHVMTDNWIPRSGLKRPLGLKPGTSVQKVEDLLLPEGQGWKMDKLQELFFESDIADITKISVGRAGTEDYLAWNYTKNGIFSVKSAYHLKMQSLAIRAGGASSSTNLEEHKGWLSLWDADIPGKAKIHIWRIIQNGLAVGCELQRRHVKEGVKCIACDREETLLHRFWTCPHSVAIWDQARQMTGFRFSHPNELIRRHRDLHGWMLDWIGKLEDKELCVCLMILYQMWLARNDAREDSKIDAPDVIVRRSLFLVDEWQGLKVSNSQIQERVVEHWCPPTVSWFKVNSDGAYSEREGCGGSGVVLRDHHGGFVAGASHFFPSVPDPERAELLACKQALKLASEKDVRKLCLESDCFGAVAKIKSRDTDRSLHGPLVEEVKALLSGFEEYSVNHVRRTGNGAAHLLAKFGRENKVCRVWDSTPPEFIVNTLVSETA